MSELPQIQNAARAMQLASAKARKGTPLARRIAAQAGASIGKKAAHIRAQKAAAARWSNPPTL